MRLEVLLALTTLGGCTGVVIDPSPGGAADRPGEPGAPAVPPGASPASAPVVPAAPASPATQALARQYFAGDRLTLLPRRVWRLTNDQIERSISLALGTPVELKSVLLPEPHDTRYRNFADQLVLSRADAEALSRAATRVHEAARLALPRLHPCWTAADQGRACAPARLRELAEALYREPPTADEAARIEALFQELVATSTPLDAAAGVVQYLVQAPGFLFRREAGAAAAREPVRTLTGHELVSALSLLFWNEPPDGALRAAARSGALATPAALEREIRRLTGDRRFLRALEDYVSQWLAFDKLEQAQKSTARFPAWSDAVRASMRRELTDFVGHVFERERGSLTALLGSPNAPRPAMLPTIYDQDRREGDRLVTRRGLVLLPGVLAALSNDLSTKPMHRAALLIDRLFCKKPDLPSGITLPERTTGGAARTTRQLFEQHAADPTCAACHRMLDPIAFALETYDAVGRYRETEVGLLIDARGDIGFTVAPFGRVESAVELFERASGHPDVAACAVRQLYEFAFGVAPTPDADPVLRAAFERLLSSGHDLREVLVAFAGSALFSQRVAPPGGTP